MSLSHPFQLWVRSIYFPQNGRNELQGMFKTLEEAQESTLANDPEWDDSCVQLIVLVEFIDEVKGTLKIAKRWVRELEFNEDAEYDEAPYHAKDKIWRQRS